MEQHPTQPEAGASRPHLTGGTPRGGRAFPARRYKEERTALPGKRSFKIFNRLNIAWKLNLGIGLLVALSLGVGLVNFAGGRQSSAMVNRTVAIRVPAALESVRAQTNLLRMQANVRGYLALSDINHMDRYNKAAEAFESNLLSLDKLSVTWAPVNAAYLEELETTFEQWTPTVRKLFELHGAPRRNQPALRIANEEIPPLRARILENVHELGTLERSRADAPLSSAPTPPVADFQISLETMIANIQAYAASGEVTARGRYGASLIAAGRAFRELSSPRAFGEGATQSRVSAIGRDLGDLFRASNRIIETMEGEHAREDLYLFWSEVSPQTERMLELLDRLTLNQQRLLEGELSGTRRNLLKTQLQTLAGIVLALLVGITTTLVFRKIISGPVGRLTTTAEEIGRGNLDILASVETDDEIGRLGATFNRMTTRLRRTITDLREGTDQLAKVAETNARLYEQKQLALNEMETLYAISRQMVTAQDLTGLITSVVEEISIPVINRAVLMVFEYDPGGTLDTIVVRSNWYGGTGTPPTPTGTRYSAEKIPLIRFFQGDAPVFFDNVLEDERVDPEALAVIRKLKIRAMVALPLHHHGRQIGTLLLEGEEPHAFSHSEIRPYLSMLGQFATAVENQRLMEETRLRAKELAAAKEKAEKANRAKSIFLANISHELRTPLNAVLGFTHLLMRDTPQGDSRHKHLTIINNSGKHLLTLINDVLEISKIEAGRIELNPKPFSLPSLLNDLEAMFRERVREKSLRLTVTCGNGLPDAVECDEDKLRQVLINLLDNAVKFTDKGGMTLRAATETEAEAEAVRLVVEVEDTGFGIDRDELGAVFKPFEQTRSGILKKKGTGLGMAISRTYARLMGGDLTVTSLPGEGSCFRLEVAVKIMGTPQTPEKVEARRVRALAAGRDGLRILVVDDNAENRMLLSRMLEPVGFRPREACNGEEAVALFEEWSPHLILMDLRMPVMDGIEAARRIKAGDTGFRTPIIAVSAAAGEEDKAEAMTVCDDFVMKPFQAEHLLERIKRLLKVQYVYEGEPLSPEGADSASPNHDAAQSPKLAAVPPGLRRELLDAVTVLNVGDINRNIEKIREYEPELFDVMKALADSFAYGKLKELLLQHPTEE